MKQKLRRASLVFALVITACSPVDVVEPTNTPQNTSTAVPTETTIPTVTSTLEPTPTIEPTSTLAPTEVAVNPQEILHMQFNAMNLEQFQTLENHLLQLRRQKADEIAALSPGNLTFTDADVATLGGYMGFISRASNFVNKDVLDTYRVSIPITSREILISNSPWGHYSRGNVDGYGEQDQYGGGARVIGSFFETPKGVGPIPAQISLPDGTLLSEIKVPGTIYGKVIGTADYNNIPGLPSELVGTMTYLIVESPNSENITLVGYPINRLCLNLLTLLGDGKYSPGLKEISYWNSIGPDTPGCSYPRATTQMNSYGGDNWKVVSPFATVAQITDELLNKRIFKPRAKYVFIGGNWFTVGNFAFERK